MKADWKPGTLLAPVPVVMVSMADAAGRANILTVAWTGIVSSEPVQVYISVRPERYSYHILKETGEFVINLTTGAMARATDFCGVRSGRDMDKLAAAKLAVEPASKLSAPVIAQSPLALECKVREIIPLGSHDMFLAKVVGVTIDNQYMDDRGKFNLNASGLTAYSHGEYFELGKKLGSFGYSVRKPAKKKKKR